MQEAVLRHRFVIGLILAQLFTVVWIVVFRAWHIRAGSDIGLSLWVAGLGLLQLVIVTWLTRALRVVAGIEKAVGELHPDSRGNKTETARYSIEELLPRIRKRVTSLAEQLSHDQVAIVKAMALSLEAKDRYTCGHCLRVRSWATKIGAALGLSDELIEATRIAAVLHDIGKIGVPDHILLKEGRLTEKERARAQMHVTIGVEILKPLSGMKDISRYIHHHHERWDGTGYPAGLRGESIPLPSRIIAVADAIDAMRSDRPYRKALDKKAVRAELEKMRGSQFDPRVVDAALSLFGAETRVNGAASEVSSEVDATTASALETA